MYVAAVLDFAEAQFLQELCLQHIPVKELGFIFETKNGDPLPHHMTINMGQFDESLNDRSILDQPVVICINKFLYNENICCAVVSRIELENEGTPIQSSNEHPHITTCLRPPAKPFESNHLFIPGTPNVSIDEIHLFGNVRICS